MTLTRRRGHLAGQHPWFTGGSVTEDDGMRIHTFTGDGTLTCLRGGEVEVFLVAGGGSGGQGGTENGCGGGGAGGVLQDDAVLSGDQAVTVGDGGTAGANGEDTSIGSNIAVGGGSGGSGGGAPAGNGNAGGSGGGGQGSSTNTTGGAATSGQGSAGGAGVAQALAANRDGAGGGGATTVGGDGPTGTNGGVGGTGIADPFGSGDRFAGGGGGGRRGPSGNGVAGLGTDGGGNGGSNSNGANATANTGSGGGGASGSTNTGGNGGSGIAKIRYRYARSSQFNITLSTPALFIELADIDPDLEGMFWTRPYPNPVAVGGGDEYIWFGSTDHTADLDDTMYRGWSASPDVAPASWTRFEVPFGGPAPETPFFVYDATRSRPWLLFFHPVGSVSGGSQSSRLVSHTSYDFENGTDEGEVLRADANLSPDLCDHTGYMTVERRGATDWHAWSRTRASGTHGRSEYGYWTATDPADPWTAVNDDLDVRSMAGTGRYIAAATMTHFYLDDRVFAVVNERAEAGGNNRVALVEMIDEETFGTPQIIWDPADHAFGANYVKSVKAYQDDIDADTIHIYLHVLDGAEVHYMRLEIHR